MVDVRWDERTVSGAALDAEKPALDADIATERKFTAPIAVAPEGLRSTRSVGTELMVASSCQAKSRSRSQRVA